MELKIRAWDGKKYHYTPDLNLHFTKGGITAAMNNGSMVFDDGENIQQFTGRYDKNDVEIYKGDIINTPSNKLLVVKWCEKFASFCLDKKGWMYHHFFGESVKSENCEIVGNIHETPQLLS